MGAEVRSRLVLSAVALCALWSSSCAPSGFAPQALIQSVRVLATSADEPYARPGDSVNVQVLAFDGRPVKNAPMTVYWLPFVCENPKDDAYYACFSQISGGGGADAGAGGGGGGGGGSGLLKPGVDLTPFLPSGTSYRFKMPADAVTSHTNTPGTRVPFGLTFIFNVACAGHLELLPIDPGNINPQAVPIGCFDAAHSQLGADDYVFGFTRVYAYPPADPTQAMSDTNPVTNSNPVIDHVDFQGNPLDLSAGIVTPRCTADKRDDCPKLKLGPVVPESSQETNPEDVDPNGNELYEEIWVDYYSTLGQFTSDARLLYDSNTKGSIGSPNDTDDEFVPPNDPGEGTIWMIVRDNRGGASWATVPVHIQ
jgi:hypothetical protein